jgi:hypothetical protein
MKVLRQRTAGCWIWRPAPAVKVGLIALCLGLHQTNELIDWRHSAPQEVI